MIPLHIQRHIIIKSNWGLTQLTVSLVRSLWSFHWPGTRVWDLELWDWGMIWVWNDRDWIWTAVILSLRGTTVWLFKVQGLGLKLNDKRTVLPHAPLTSRSICTKDRPINSFPHIHVSHVHLALLVPQLEDKLKLEQFRGGWMIQTLITHRKIHSCTWGPFPSHQ